VKFCRQSPSPSPPPPPSFHLTSVRINSVLMILLNKPQDVNKDSLYANFVRYHLSCSYHLRFYNLT
jgi:hypothetical protein